IPNVNLKETPTEIKERLVHEYNETERIYNSLEKFPDIFVPRPIAIYPANLTYVIGECPGKPLSQLIEKKCKIWSPSFKRKNSYLLFFLLERPYKLFTI
ncbi:MAG: hypothetical protein ACE5FU_11380, partial [Nitrospinota bacterium]